MNTSYVHEFITLAEIKNYLESADVLFLSQSTLSRHIQNLEKDLGVPLFIRTTRKVILSDYGEAFLPYAKKIVQMEQEGIQTIQKRKGSKDTLTIGSVPIMTQYNISGILAQFQQKHPNISMVIIENGLEALKDSLKLGECDFIFAQEKKKKHDEFIHVPYVSDRLVLMLPKEHPLANRPSVSIEQLKSESFLMLPENTLVNHLFMGLCSSAKFVPRISITVRTGDSAVDLVSKGMGITTLMKQTALYLCKENTAIVEIEPYTQSYINILYPKNTILSDAATCFLRYMKEL